MSVLPDDNEDGASSVCGQITEAAETERTRRSYEDTIQRRHTRLMAFVDTHVKEDSIKQFIRVGNTLPQATMLNIHIMLDLRRRSW